MKSGIRLLIVAMSVALFGCNVEDPLPTHESSVEAGTFETSLQLLDSFDQESPAFVQGEPIRLVLSVTNLSDESQTLTFASAQRADSIVVEKESEALVWRWSEDKGFAAVLTEETWEPNETRTFEFEWEQELSSGELLPVGEYHAQGMLALVGVDVSSFAPESQFRSAPVTFTIQ